MSVHILENKNDVRETLQKFLDERGDLMEAVMIVGVEKENGTQHMVSSTCNQYLKCFMVQFLQAWVSKWFEL